MFKSNMRLCSAFALLLLSSYLLIPAGAQSSRGELAGNVTDSSGAVVQQATVTATSESMGIKE